MWNQVINRTLNNVKNIAFCYCFLWSTRLGAAECLRCSVFGIYDVVGKFEAALKKLELTPKQLKEYNTIHRKDKDGGWYIYL